MNSKKLIYLFVVLFFFFGINFAYFQTQDETTENQQQSDVNQTTNPTSLNNPLGNVNTPELLIGNIINTVFGVVGSLALLMFIYGGLTWMTSAGNKEAVDKGKRIITWAAIGLVIIFTSYALVRFLIVGVGAA